MRERQRGQVLALFAGGLIGFLAIAALVFDVGQNLVDWRTQRNVADAAALAGARYIAEDPCEATPNLDNCGNAVSAALQLAALNGYGDGATNCSAPTSGLGIVCVYVPPRAGTYAQSGFLEVTIHTDRPSFFAAVLGVLQQNVDALAIAGQSDSIAPPYSMLALNPDCDPNPSGQVGGNGATAVDGAVLVNSNCEGALQVNGRGSLEAPECSVVGTATEDGANANLACEELVQGPPFTGAGDPLITADPGPKPSYPAATEVLFRGDGRPPIIPAGCPGSTSEIHFIAAAAAALATVTLPPYTIGDIALVFAYRTGSDSPPDLPTDLDPDTGLPMWTNLDAGGGDLNSSRVFWRKLTGAIGEATVTAPNATATEVIILRGQDTDNPIGAHAAVGAVGTMTTPALTLTPSPTSTAWVVAFGGAASGANLTTLAIPGQIVTNRNQALVSSLALHTGEDLTPATGWPATNYGASPAGANRTYAIEILANPNPSSMYNPAGCVLGGAGGQMYNVYRLHPGVYYGGIEIKSKARVYLAPGTYWLAGGGLKINAKDAQLISDNVASGPPTATGGRGVFFYFTEDRDTNGDSLCGRVPGNPCIGGMQNNGTSSNECATPVQPVPPTWSPSPPPQPCQWLHLEPASRPVVPITNLLVFVDRAFSGIDIFFNGDAGKLELMGTIYNPGGQVRVNGGAGDTMSAQIIAYTFKITGNGGFDVNYEADGVVQLTGAGLVR